MKNTLKTLSILGLALTVTACGSIRPSMYEESRLTQRKIVVEEKRYVDTQNIDNVDYNYLMGLTHDYDRHGNSPLYIALSYDPNAKNAKSATSMKSSILKGQLAKLGIKNAVIKSIPVMNSNGDVVIGYDRVTAKGPEGCGQAPGFGKPTGEYGSYGLGCSLQNAMAKQIAYPSDLTSKSNTDMGEWDASRAASAVDGGDPAPFVPSYILSELAGNTTE